MEMKVRYSVNGEETYSGVNCWVLSYTTTMEQQGMTMKNVVTWWMAKSDLHAVHGRTQTYVNDNLVSQQEFDPEQAPKGTEPPEPANVNYAVGYETITVLAGTFTNCIKVEVTKEGHLVRMWAHPNVPVWGFVKMEGYEDSKLSMTMELISYGG